MAKTRKAQQSAPRTGHRHVVTAETPRPAPNQSMSLGTVSADKPRPAPNQSVPAAGVVNADNPVPAAAQSAPVSAPKAEPKAEAKDDEPKPSE